jgi:hypothetical protein
VGSEHEIKPIATAVVAVTISTFRTEFSGRLVDPMESYAGGVTEFLTKGGAADGSIRPTWRVQGAANLIELHSRFPKAVVRLSAPQVQAHPKQRKFREPWETRRKRTTTAIG